MAFLVMFALSSDKEQREFSLSLQYNFPIHFPLESFTLINTETDAKDVTMVELVLAFQGFRSLFLVSASVSVSVNEP